MAKRGKVEERRQREAEVAAYVKERQAELAEKAGFKDNRQATEYLAKQEFVLERFELIASKLADRKHVPAYKGKVSKDVQRVVNAQWSDLHFGANLDPRLVPFAYGETEERRRFAAVCAQMADYKRQYRAESTLHIHLIGDVLQGKLHDPQSAAVITEQVDRASHHLVHGLEFLATEYSKVVVDTSVGNHGRDVIRHPERAVNDKYDSMEFRLYRLLHWTFRNHPRVEIRTPIRPYYIYEQFGMKGLMTHGDTIFNPGYPNRAIHVEALQAQINRFLVSYQDAANLKLFGFGHVHVPMSMRLSGGQVLLTNGALIPSDEYALSIGIHNTPCSQNLWETVPGYLFGDHRWMDISQTHDQDKSLDKIIPAWVPFK